MTLDTSFDLFGVGFEIDPLTGVEVDNGLGEVQVDPTGSTSVGLLGAELVGVDLTTGTAVEVLGNEIVDVGLSEGIPIEADLIQGVLFGVGEELLFGDLSQGVAIATDLLTESGIDIPPISDI